MVLAVKYSMYRSKKPSVCFIESISNWRYRNGEWYRNF